ncbi:hypothetical protein EGW08_000953 [Elysia chlorotica]|uniref:Uncharacterized protein n=1 Tax=Elysia chlorotica TaxID=188477 RepID=A0A3S1BTN0_ELYCH|nr:hypothetical protein EGW08_000953 [Elysia chlorotica]
MGYVWLPEIQKVHVHKDNKTIGQDNTGRDPASGRTGEEPEIQKVHVHKDNKTIGQDNTGRDPALGRTGEPHQAYAMYHRVNKSRVYALSRFKRGEGEVIIAPGREAGNRSQRDGSSTGLVIHDRITGLGSLRGTKVVLDPEGYSPRHPPGLSNPSALTSLTVVHSRRTRALTGQVEAMVRSGTAAGRLHTAMRDAHSHSQSHAQIERASDARRTHIRRGQRG